VSRCAATCQFVKTGKERGKYIGPAVRWLLQGVVHFSSPISAEEMIDKAAISNQNPSVYLPVFIKNFNTSELLPKNRMPIQNIYYLMSKFFPSLLVKTGRQYAFILISILFGRNRLRDCQSSLMSLFKQYLRVAILVEYEAIIRCQHPKQSDKR